MAELLFEVFSEEIPARMQVKGGEQLLSSVCISMKEANIAFGEARFYVTPRRLAIHIEDIPKEIGSKSTERKGPKIDAPEGAINGFLKSCGITKSQAQIKDIKGMRYYFAVIEEEAKSVEQELLSILNNALQNFTWPKSMRWGAEKIRWVRPIHNILCLFDGKILEVEFGPFKANDKTYGHRFMAPKDFTVKNFKDYKAKLEKAFVILDQKKRKEIINKDISKALARENLALKEDEGLLNEVTGLVEWPNVLMGNIEKRFMKLPEEVLTISMKSHQKYFSCLDKSRKLAANFITVSNIKTKNDQLIIDGNEKVLRARLADAEFFWNLDLREKLESNVDKLKKVTFHTKLGSVFDKTQRIVELSKFIQKHVEADAKLVKRAASLCKADLVTEMVGEFPELQGVIGRYYAVENKEDKKVAEAISDHYLPLGPTSNVPRSKVSAIVSIADKIDTLVGLWLVGELPTGSKDPFGLRRTSLGCIRIILEHKIEISLSSLIKQSIEVYKKQIAVKGADKVLKELQEFFTERLKQQLKSENIRHDIIAATISNLDDLYVASVKVRALENFLNTDNGNKLLQAYRRASNIVSAEEKKDKTSYSDEPKSSMLKQKEELELYSNLEKARVSIQRALEKNDFLESMKQLEYLRKPIDNFFDKVTVNDEDKEIRKNRLMTLGQVRKLLDNVADFSVIEL